MEGCPESTSAHGDEKIPNSLLGLMTCRPLCDPYSGRFIPTPIFRYCSWKTIIHFFVCFCHEQDVVGTPSLDAHHTKCVKVIPLQP